MGVKIVVGGWYPWWECLCGHGFNMFANEADICPICSRPKSKRVPMIRRDIKEYTTLMRVPIWSTNKYEVEDRKDIPYSPAETCSSCNYSRDGVGGLLCCRNAPSVNFANDSPWPPAPNAGWCGEYLNKGMK